MTSFQSQLGEDEGIAEELAASQREISIAEFFEKNKHMLGFDSGARGLVTAVKEAVDRGIEVDLDTGLAIERALFAGLFATEDREIGMQSFMDSGPGKAQFTGR